VVAVILNSSTGRMKTGEGQRRLWRVGQQASRLVQARVRLEEARREEKVRVVGRGWGTTMTVMVADELHLQGV
jgi:hypothetical protein